MNIMTWADDNNDDDHGKKKKKKKKKNRIIKTNYYNIYHLLITVRKLMNIMTWACE